MKSGGYVIVNPHGEMVDWAEDAFEACRLVSLWNDEMDEARTTWRRNWDW